MVQSTKKNQTELKHTHKMRQIFFLCSGLVVTIFDWIEIYEKNPATL